MSDDDWDDVLGDRAKQTVSPDVVRKLLEMNPALRERGMTTNIAMGQMNEAQANKPASGAVVKKPMSSASTSRPQSGGPDLFSAVNELRTRLVSGSKRIDDEIARLTKEKAALTHAMRDQLTQWFVANDPNIQSPVSQRVLDQEKKFFDQLGFTIDGYIAARTKKK